MDHLFILHQNLKNKNKSTFVMPIGKFEFKKVPFCLAQAPTHFQWLINDVLKGIPFTSGYFII